jgi:hypothetical protein
MPCCELQAAQCLPLCATLEHRVSGAVVGGFRVGGVVPITLKSYGGGRGSIRQLDFGL